MMCWGAWLFWFGNAHECCEQRLIKAVRAPIHILFTKGSDMCDFQSLMFLIFVFSDVIKLSSEALRVSQYQKWCSDYTGQSCIGDILFDNYSSVALFFLIDLTISSLSGAVPKWHVVSQQHGREFRARRIMATSYPQGSELYYSFPVLYWVSLQTWCSHETRWVAQRFSGEWLTARRCCPGSPPTAKRPCVETKAEIYFFHL